MSEEQKNAASKSKTTADTPQSSWVVQSCLIVGLLMFGFIASHVQANNPNSRPRFATNGKKLINEYELKRLQNYIDDLQWSKATGEYARLKDDNYDMAIINADVETKLHEFVRLHIKWHRFRSALRESLLIYC